MSKRTARVPAFSRLSTHIKNLSKAWYKKHIARRNRRNLHQSRELEDFQDKPLDPRSLD